MHIRAILLALGILSMHSLASARLQTQGGGGHQLVTPPVEAWFSGRATVPTGVDPDLTMSVIASTDSRTVTVWWHYRPKDQSWSTWTSVKQDYSTTFWPTCVSQRGNNSFYIGGMRTDQGSRVEVWEFPTPSLDTTTPLIQVGGRSSVTAVLNEKDPARQVPFQLSRLRSTVPGADLRVMVQFWGDKSVWLLNEASGSIGQLASTSAQPPSGVMSIPQLDQHFAGFMARDHQQYGYVYIFTFVSGEGFVADGSQTVVLYDQDRNGQLDGHLVLDESTWETNGFNLSSQYND